METWYHIFSSALCYLAVEAALHAIYRARLFAGYLSLILCFWQCYQRYNSKPLCGKSTPAPWEREAQQPPWRAAWPQRKLLRGPALINLTHFLRDVRETRGGGHFITRKGSLRSAFSTSCLNTEEEMALIMFSGMFGLGEMVSYISFMGAGGRGCWCGRLLRARLKNFSSSSWLFEWCLLAFLLHPVIGHLLVFCVCFFMSFTPDNTIKHFSWTAFGEYWQCLRWHVCAEITVFQRHVPLTDFGEYLC